MDILMSIQPKYAEAILNGAKLYEYRKTLPKQSIGRVVIYASSPVQRIIGEFAVGEILTGSPEYVWEKTGHVGGVSKEFFYRYFIGKSVAYAIHVVQPVRYDEPINPFETWPGFRPPQSYMYMLRED